MHIHNVYELIDFVKSNEGCTLSSYDGDWSAYDKDNNIIKNVTFNNLMMRELANAQLIAFDNYVISHHNFRNYRINDVETFEERIAQFKSLMKTLIKSLKYFKFKSLKGLIEDFKNVCKISYDKEYYPVNYWGGGRYVMTLMFRDLQTNKPIFYCPYYYAENLKGNGLYNILISTYARIFDGFELYSQDYREYITDNSFRTSQEYYNLRNKAWKETYRKICEE